LDRLNVPKQQKKYALDELGHSLHPLCLSVIHSKRIKKLITVEPKTPIGWVNFECVNFLVNTLNAFSFGRQHIGRMCEGSRNLGASKKDSKQKVGSVRF